MWVIPAKRDSSLNGVPGAVVRRTVTGHEGGPGTNDTAQIQIKDKTGNQVLNVTANCPRATNKPMETKAKAKEGRR